MNSETPGNRIRTARIKLGITQKQLGRLVDLTEQNVNRIEVGLTPIAPEYLRLIAAALGTTEEVLLRGELHAERVTREELLRMLDEGIIDSAGEFDKVFDLATNTIPKRSNANIPLSRQELLNLIELIRGADGL